MTTKKDSMLHIRATSADIERIQQAAKESGMSLSEFCLNAILIQLGDEPFSPRQVLERLKKLEERVMV